MADRMRVIPCLRADRRQVFMLAAVYDFNDDDGTAVFLGQGDAADGYSERFGLPHVGDPILLVEPSDGPGFGIVATVTHVSRHDDGTVFVKTDYRNGDDVRDVRPWWGYDSPGRCDAVPARTFGSGAEVPRCSRDAGHDGQHEAFSSEVWA